MAKHSISLNQDPPSWHVHDGARPSKESLPEGDGHLWPPAM